MNLYLDASVLMPAVIEEPSSTAVRELFRNRPDELSVGDFAAAEVASALSRLVRMERLTATEAAERLADFDEWRASATEVAEIDTHDCRLANTYVRRFDLKLRAPDALLRTGRALASRRPPDDIDLGEARAAFAQLLGQAGSVTG